MALAEPLAVLRQPGDMDDDRRPFAGHVRLRPVADPAAVDLVRERTGRHRALDPVVDRDIETARVDQPLPGLGVGVDAGGPQALCVDGCLDGSDPVPVHVEAPGGRGAREPDGELDDAASRVQEHSRVGRGPTLPGGPLDSGRIVGDWHVREAGHVRKANARRHQARPAQLGIRRVEPVVDGRRGEAGRSRVGVLDAEAIRPGVVLLVELAAVGRAGPAVLVALGVPRHA